MHINVNNKSTIQSLITQKCSKIQYMATKAKNLLSISSLNWHVRWWIAPCSVKSVRTASSYVDTMLHISRTHWRIWARLVPQPPVAWKPLPNPAYSSAETKHFFATTQTYATSFSVPVKLCQQDRNNNIEYITLFQDMHVASREQIFGKRCAVTFNQLLLFLSLMVLVW